VPKAPKSLPRKEDFWATSFLWMPKGVPARKQLRHGRSGDLGGLGGCQIGKIFWERKMKRYFAVIFPKYRSAEVPW